MPNGDENNKFSDDQIIRIRKLLLAYKNLKDLFWSELAKRILCFAGIPPEAFKSSELDQEDLWLAIGEDLKKFVEMDINQTISQTNAIFTNETWATIQAFLKSEGFGENFFLKEQKQDGFWDRFWDYFWRLLEAFPYVGNLIKESRKIYKESKCRMTEVRK